MFSSFFNFFIYFLFSLLGFFISLFPHKILVAFGKITGRALYYLHRPFRKKTLTNLSIAFGKDFDANSRKKIAIESFQNLMITCLEYFYFKRYPGNVKKLVYLQEEEKALTLLHKKQGIVFLTGHLANWEIPFIAMTEKAQGVAIGRPIKNPWMYRWVLSVREMNGGKIVLPKNAIKQGLKTLREGNFMGIVGDQAFPESPYSYPFFGTRAWTTTAPALLAYKSNCPIIVVSTTRVGHRYLVQGSAPLWPDLTRPKEEEIPRLMNDAMSFLEKSIREHPGQWMWQHDRWKQQGIDHIKREFRYGFILVVIPQKQSMDFLSVVPLLKKIYSRSFLTIALPEPLGIPSDLDVSILKYREESDLLLEDWRYQLLLDFSNSKRLKRYFLKRGVFKALSLEKMQKISKESKDLEQIIKKTLVKSECLQTVSL